MRVMLSTPSLVRQPCLEYMMSVMRTQNRLMQHGHFLDTSFVGSDAFIAKARNLLAQSFIDSWKGPYPADALVFIDDDQSWDEQSFLRIITDTHEFIGVAIPKKMDTDPLTFNNVALDVDDKGACYIERGFMRCTQIGSGFIAIKRSAIEKLIKAHPRQYAPGDGSKHERLYNLFEAKIVWGDSDEMYEEALTVLRALAEEGLTAERVDAAKAVLEKIADGKTKLGQFWGEDLVLCKKWIDMGEKIWLDPNVTCEHIGRKSWAGNFLEFLQKHASVQVSGPKAPAADAPFVPIPETLAAIEKIAA